MSQTPNITDHFTWNGRHYRATSYIKVATIELSPMMARLLGRTHVRREVFCTREEAEYVCGAGVAGCCAPVGEVTDVSPMTGWTQEMIDDDVSLAARLVGTYVH